MPTSTQNPHQIPTFRDAQEAFKDAIWEDRLDENPNSPRYAGLYMYMGTVNGRDLFKHINTREYIS